MELLTRDAFRTAVFARDKQACVLCGEPGKDAHHIIERRLWTDGGYYLDNGATLCQAHHLRAEETTLSCDEIRKAAGITRILLPEHLYADDFRYDKWGNILQTNGTRLRGELFYDDSVQKILRQGGVLDLFVPYVKYPRTHHLPWSHPKTDDKFLPTTEHLGNEEIVVTVKMDGEQTNLYPDHIHARSLDFLVGEKASFVKPLWDRVRFDIPEGWRLCGENFFERHSLYYRLAKPPYFNLFSIWDDRNVCQSWDDTEEWAAMLDLGLVPLLYRGPWDEMLLRELHRDAFGGDPCEGYVVRPARAFAYGEFRQVVAKYVRPDFKPGHAKNYRQGPLIANGKPDFPES